MKKNRNSAEKKKVPMRTCCGCRQTFPKKELIRIVRTKEGFASLDKTGKMNGRGTYICKNTACLDMAKKTGAIARSLEIHISSEIYESLKTELECNED